MAWAKDNLALVEEKGQYKGRFTETSIRAVLSGAPLFRPFSLHSSARDSLFIDVAGALCSYFQLRAEDPKTGFPVCRDPRSETYPDALDDFAAVTDDETEENECRARLLRVARGSVMPLYFARPDGVPNNRNFSLLRDPEHGRYYALLYLLTGRNNGQPQIETMGNLERMGWPQGSNREDERPRFTARPSGALLLPLALGNWHAETFLDACVRGEANARSAFLSRADDDRHGLQYYVHVTFEYAPEKVIPETYLGVDRGIANLIAITIMNRNGDILHQELHPGADLIDFQKYVFTEYRGRQRRGKDIRGQRMIRRANEEVCHRLANVIRDLATTYRSQVCMEYLKGFKEQKRDFGLLKRQPLQRIEQILEYKLPLRGLPPLRTVSPAYTSRECPRCGYGFGIKGKGVNRPSQAEFRCDQCAYETHADLNGSHNIARRWIATEAQRGRARTLTTA